MSDPAALPAPLTANLRLPLVAAPMFLVSGAELVIATCRAGAIGAFPAANARTIDALDAMCARIVAGRGGGAAAWAVNLLCHSTYDRLDAELEVLVAHRPPLVISALGSPARIVDAVHGYGGTVFADVATPAHARKALAARADGVVLVCAGAGGHTGHLSPFAFMSAVRAFWAGPVVLAGGIADGAGVAAAVVAGASAAYAGTRFIAARESLVAAAYREMAVASTIDDIVLSDAVTGIPANWMAASLAGRVSDAPVATADFSGAIAEGRAWRDIWSAGQSVTAVTAVTSAAEIVAELERGYRAAMVRQHQC